MIVFCSILGRIIRVTDEVLEYRQWIRENFPLDSSSSVPKVVPLFTRQSTVGLPGPLIPGQPLFQAHYPPPYSHYPEVNASTGSSNQSSRSSSSPLEPCNGDFNEIRSNQNSPVDLNES